MSNKGFIFVNFSKPPRYNRVALLAILILMKNNNFCLHQGCFRDYVNVLYFKLDTENVVVAGSMTPRPLTIGQFSDWYSGSLYVDQLSL